MVGTWVLLCPTDCAPLMGECYYTGGHGKPLVLVCEKGLKSISYDEAYKKLKTHKALPKRGTGLKVGRAGKRRKGRPRTVLERMKRHPSNPRRRKYLPYGLTACEKKHPHVRRKLSRCIKKLEPRERAGEIKSAVAVCRASIPCP